MYETFFLLRSLSDVQSGPRSSPGSRAELAAIRKRRAENLRYFDLDDLGEVPMSKLQKQHDSRVLAQSLIIALAFAFAHAVAATPSAHGQNYAVVHSFSGGSDGAAPTADLVKDPAGN